ncbi:zinc-binding alcohol dehydrogenase family protein [Bogoriella caseilytica]|uniref:Threonine dehydrogenase-like Zn-dependent dehydrogenase n=1 Tax=Bogoriella caseilytica TaxID=56055 RepID=A0A3N2BAU9_9MICO|nr:zinc-binding alcohol dehydrogenase family protein [Bogoriella caseilytica]ROR72403.1 threonine dehydrogenase-like Zn-dependent dehydrogenase [Bogoriella caseilytica]
MKAVHVVEPGKIAVVDAALPVPQADEALLRVRYAGICGSDLQTFAGTQPFATYPRVPGHEFSAEVVEVNGDARDLTPGLLVTGNPYFNCGACYSCRRGLVNCCQNNETMGVHRDGSFQEYIVMPVDRVHPAAGVDPQIAAMVEPFSIGYHAMNRARVTRGDKVLVIGAGAIGMLAMVSAQAKGADVWIADVLPERLEIARAMGAKDAFDLRGTEMADVASAATGGDGFDVVAEATGLPVSFLNAIEAASFGGRIALIGNGTREVTFNQSTLIKKELDVVGSRNSLNAFEPLIQLLHNQTVDIAPIRTSVRPFTDTVDAMRDLREHPDRNIKVLIEF